MRDEQDRLYAEADAQFAPAIARLAGAMERDAEKARDLAQDIQCELWRSFARFDGRCALKTWVYRVAHNVAAEHVARAMRRRETVPLEDIDTLPDPGDTEGDLAENHALAQVRELIRTLPTLDAQVILLWLEGESAADIAEVTGLTANAVGVRTHRIRKLLAAEFAEGTDDD